MMRCPFCKKSAHVRTTRYLSGNVKQSYLLCVNVFCSAIFRTTESIDNVIRPTAKAQAPALALLPRLRRVRCVAAIARRSVTNRRKPV